MIDVISNAVYSALNDQNYLPNVEYMERSGSVQERRPYINEVQVYLFPQTWGSTALGFGGMGVHAMITAYTTIVMHGDVAAVFFGGRHAYTVKVNEAFNADMACMHMRKVSEKSKYGTL